MRAARVHQFGGLDALVVEDLPRPNPGEGRVCEMPTGAPLKRGKIVLTVGV